MKNILDEKECISVSSLLLDSSLITQSNLKKYNCKIIRCGDYNQVYIYDETKTKKDPFLEGIGEIKKTNKLDLFKEENIKRKDEKKFIEYKNILRSKFSMQRLVKANEKDFKTFVTLTFADNITSLKEAHKSFNSWVTYIRQLKKDFKYIAVPEFQKRGAVHYHLLTNLSIKNDTNIILLQKGKKNMYDVVGWNKGFTSVFDLKNIDVVAYLSKYMTKDIDSRLWGHRRYYNSLNLIKPKEEFIDLSNKDMYDYFIKLISNSNIKYTNKYIDILSSSEITFIEYKKN